MASVGCKFLLNALAPSEASEAPLRMLFSLQSLRSPADEKPKKSETYHWGHSLGYFFWVLVVLVVVLVLLGVVSVIIGVVASHYCY